MRQSTAKGVLPFIIYHSHTPIVVLSSRKTRIFYKSGRTRKNRKDEGNESCLDPRGSGITGVFHQISVVAQERWFVENRKQGMEPCKVSINLVKIISDNDLIKPRQLPVCQQGRVLDIQHLLGQAMPVLFQKIRMLGNRACLHLVPENGDRLPWEKHGSE